MGQSVQGTNNRRAQCRTQHRTICFCKSFNPKSLVRMRGLEPPRGCPRSHLKAVRLPISPHPRNFTTFEPPSLNCYLKVLDTVSPGVPILCSPSGMWKSVSPSIPGFPKHRCKTVSTPASDSSVLRGVREDFRSRQDQADAGGIRFVGVGERMGSVEDETSSVQLGEVDSCGIALREVQCPHKGTGDSVLRKGLQRHKVVVAVDGGHDDSALASCSQFRVHHDSGSAAVAIGEWMDLRYEEHHEDRTMQRSGETPVDFEARSEEN